jgi:dTDP-L-rhamnose 4-epimerase
VSSILVTGGAGFIGCRLARSLLDQGHAVTVVDVLHPQVHSAPGRPADLPAEAELLTADVTSATCWDGVLKVVSPDVVVNLAAETGTGQSLTEATRHGSVNVVGTTQMLDALFRAGSVPAHLLLASSRAVYGEGRWAADDGSTFYPGVRTHDQLARAQWDPRSPTGEPARPLPSRAGATEPRPANVYAATKLAQEHVMAAWAAAMGSALSVLRLQNVYGPGQSLTNSYTGVMTLFARQALAGDTIDVYEDGNIVRDFVYVDDVVAAFVSAVASPPAGRRTVDIGSGTAATIADAATIIAKIAGAPAPEISGRFRDGA